MPTNSPNAAQRHEILLTIVRMWRDLLGGREVAACDNFFNLGGDSLQATELMRRVQDCFQVNVDPLAVFHAPVLKDFAAVLTSMINSATEGYAAGFDTRTDSLITAHAGGLNRKPLPALARQIRPAVIPLSFSQKAWCNTASIHVVEQRMLLLRRLSGHLNIARLERAIYRLKISHEILSTRYGIRAGTGYQEVMQPSVERLIVDDLSSLPFAVGERRVWEILHQLNSRMILPEEPVLDLRVFRMGENDHYLAGFVSHMVFDAESVDPFWKTLFDHYRNDRLDFDESADELQFADFALWENALLTDEQVCLSNRFWNERLAETLPVSLPGAPNPMQKPSPWGIAAVGCDDVRFAAIAHHAQHAGVTVPILLLGTLAVVFSRWTNQNRPLFGSVISGRPPGLADAIGCFVQMRPFYLDLSADPTFTQLMTLSRSAYIETNSLSLPPPRELIERLQIARLMVNITVSKDYSQDCLHEGTGLHVTRRSLPNPLKAEVSHDMSLSLSYGPKSLDGWLVYAADRFKRGEMKQLIQSLLSFIEKGIQAPDSRISTL